MFSKSLILQPIRCCWQQINLLSKKTNLSSPDAPSYELGSTAKPETNNSTYYQLLYTSIYITYYQLLYTSMYITCYQLLYTGTAPVISFYSPVQHLVSVVIHKYLHHLLSVVIHKYVHHLLSVVIHQYSTCHQLLFTSTASVISCYTPVQHLSSVVGHTYTCSSSHTKLKEFIWYVNCMWQVCQFLQGYVKGTCMLKTYIPFTFMWGYIQYPVHTRFYFCIVHINYIQLPWITYNYR